MDDKLSMSMFASSADYWRARAEAAKKDAERWEWLVRHASLGFDAAPSWNAVIRLPVFSSDDQTITALVDRAAAITAAPAAQQSPPA